MSLGTCMSCFSVHVRIYDVKNTSLQYVYEKITNFKVHDDCHSLCFICYTRLQQCYFMLKQIVSHQTCLRDDIAQNVEHQPFAHLSMQNMEINSTAYNILTVKQELEDNQYSDDMEGDEEVGEGDGDDGVKSILKHYKDKRIKVKNKNKLKNSKRKQPMRGISKTSYSCDMCNEKFKLLTKLNKHKCPNSDKRNCCSICGEKFSILGNLNRHRKAHTGEKPYSCNVCDKKFKRSDHLKAHRMSHTGDRPYHCDICNMTFIRSDHLKTHQITHTNEKPHRCNICERRFAARYNLKVHILTHTGKKSFVCEICNMEFYRSNNLKMHQWVHSGKKPHSCNICSKVFLRKDHLKSHLKMHNRKGHDIY